jgi:hypothetical protein
LQFAEKSLLRIRGRSGENKEKEGRRYGVLFCGRWIGKNSGARKTL